MPQCSNIGFAGAPGMAKMAERVGFEPTLPVKVNTLSKRAVSATHPPLQKV